MQTRLETRSFWTSVIAVAIAACIQSQVASNALAQVDGVVQLGLVSHCDFTDRRPICPMNGQAFDVLFQSAKGDLTGARVGYDEGSDGVGIAWANATLQGSRGRYDLWKASIPASPSGKVSYLFEFSDGAGVGYLGTEGTSAVLPASTSWWKIDSATLEHAPIGATPTSVGTVFKVWAPGATTCNVRGSFSNWGTGTALTKRGEHFVGVVANATAGQSYKYFFNNNLWKPDPRAAFIDNANNYNALISDPLSHSWRFPNFAPVPREQWVVYQLHVGSFSGLNDPVGSFTRQGRFRDVGLRADHLVQLGVNAVMLNPINEFPGSASGGYNPLTVWSFESTYGSPDDLKFMVDELHARGIAVIVDVVWNHFSDSGNFLWNFDGTQAYFDTPAVNTPWGAQADLDKAAVRSYFLDSVEHFFGTFRLDGYRQDALYEIVGASQSVPGQAMMRAAMDRVHRRFGDAHVIGEAYNNSPWNTSTLGLDMDGQYHEAFKNAIGDAINAAASGDPDVGRLASRVNGSGAYVEGTRVLNYFELHDDAWPLNGNQRAPRDIDPAAPHDDQFARGRSKLGNGLTILARGMPAILQGTEWLESNGFEEQKIDWSKKTTYASIFRFYQDIIRLRTTEPAFFADSRAIPIHVNETGNIFAFDRSKNGGESFIVLTNFSNTHYTEYFIGVPRAGGWKQIINSEDSFYGGTGNGLPSGFHLFAQPIARDLYAQRVRVSLPPHSIIVLQNEPELCSADVDFDDAVTVADLFAFLDDWFMQSGASGGFYVSDFDQDGVVTIADLFGFLDAWFDQNGAGGCG